MRNFCSGLCLKKIANLKEKKIENGIFEEKKMEFLKKKK
jgi:hypothetical protein